MKKRMRLNWIGQTWSIWLCLFTLVGLSLLSSCSDEDTASKNFKIGVLAPVTGAIASTGISASAAISLAEEDVNQYLESFGDGLTISFVINDTEADPARALDQLKAFDQQGIKHVIGPYTSANAAAVLDYANANGITLLSPASVASTLAIPNDNLFRVVPDDRNQAEAIAALFAYDQVDYIIPVVRNEVWGTGLIGEVTQLLVQEGKIVVSPIFYDPALVNENAIIAELATTINQTLQQVPAAKTAVYVLSFGEGTAILSAASTSPECAMIRWYGSSAFATTAGLVLDPAASAFADQQNLRCPIFAPDQSAKDLWEPILMKLSDQLGRLPEVYALTTYDAAWLMALAYRDSPDPDNVEWFNSSLMQTAGIFYGITGRTVFNEAGDRKVATYSFWGVSFDNGAYHWEEFGNYSNSTKQLVIY